MIKFLKGKKTYILAIAAAVVIILMQTNKIQSATALNVLTWIGILAVITFRSAISNIIVKKK